MRKRVKNFFAGGEPQEQDTVSVFTSPPWMNYVSHSKLKYPQWQPEATYLDEEETDELEEPDWDKALNLFFENLQNNENESGEGFVNGLYHPYTDELTGNYTVGNGVDLKYHPEYAKEAEKGITPKRMREIEHEIAKDEYKHFIERITKEGGDYRKIPIEWYAGLYDMFWQLGNGLYKKNKNGQTVPAYPKFWHALANLDYSGVFNESLTYANGKPMYRRRELRNDAFWLPGHFLFNGQW